jgi:hypothetical protein
MANPNTAQIQTLRTLGFGSITTSYAAVGTKYEIPLRMVRIINNTNGDLFFTTNPAVDQFFLPAASFVLYDVAGNSGPNTQFRLQGDLQFYVKYSTAPNQKDVFIEAIA